LRLAFRTVPSAQRSARRHAAERCTQSRCADSVPCEGLRRWAWQRHGDLPGPGCWRQPAREERGAAPCAGRAGMGNLCSGGGPQPGPLRTALAAHLSPHTLALLRVCLGLRRGQANQVMQSPEALLSDTSTPWGRLHSVTAGGPSRSVCSSVRA